MMKKYLVGGAVRDTLLGRPVKDRDFVVIGSTPAEMISLGFTQVGADFPIFLHPTTGEEYALARRLRHEQESTTPVSLAEDLSRRDLTINAMAMDDDGALIDLHGGQRDLRARLLRHVGETFAEDPVRILRVARFAARYTDFTVADETIDLMRHIVISDGLDAIAPERIWQELSRGLMERKPSRMLDVLGECGALAYLMPEINRLYGIPQPVAHHPEGDVGTHIQMVVDWAAAQEMSLPVRFAALMHDVGKGVTPADKWPSHHNHEALGVPLIKALCARFKVPSDCRDAALLGAALHTRVHTASVMGAAGVVRLLKAVDAIRRPERLEDLINAARADFYGRTGQEGKLYAEPDLLRKALAAMRSVDAAAVAKKTPRPADIPMRLHAAYVSAIKHAKYKQSSPEEMGSPCM